MTISPLITNSCRNCTAKCCRGLAVVLTIPEARRMAHELGLAPSEFMEFSDQIDSGQTPHYPLLVRDGDKVREYFIILRRRHKTECIFLGKDLACSVYSHRPHVCRLYPFELEGKGVKEKALCPVKFVKEEGTDKVAAQLMSELIEHGKLARQWHQKFGDKGAPDMGRFAEYFGSASVARV